MKKLALGVTLALGMIAVAGQPQGVTIIMGSSGGGYYGTTYYFSPETVTIPVGTTVTWVNRTSVTHTVTSRTGAFDSRDVLPGQQFTYTFTQAGAYDYYCRYHGGMTGRVIVEQTQKELKLFTAKLDGKQEVPAPPKPNEKALGVGAFVLSSDGKELGFALTYSDLSGPAVAIHFHNGEVGKAGPVVQTICGPQNQNPLLGACPAGTAGTVAGVWKIPADQADALLKGNLYVNVHTPDNPGGEIRGQIKESK
jgi:plastocyanin